MALCRNMSTVSQKLADAGADACSQYDEFARVHPMKPPFTAMRSTHGDQDTELTPVILVGLPRPLPGILPAATGPTGRFDPSTRGIHWNCRDQTDLWALFAVTAARGH